MLKIRLPAKSQKLILIKISKKIEKYRTRLLLLPSGVKPAYTIAKNVPCTSNITGQVWGLSEPRKFFRHSHFASPIKKFNPTTTMPD